MINKLYLKTLVARHFPPLKFGWAYGSGVFPQSGSAPANMVDLFFVVQNTHNFHRSNLQRNPSHYSGLSYGLGAEYIDLINSLVFPIHFNSHIQVDNIKIKYGVVAEETFLTDLKTWEYLTVAGRLHKPVMILTNKVDYMSQLETNLVSALAFGLLEIEQTTTQKQLYQEICRLSYRGDVRYKVNLQNKSKVENIVAHNLPRFRELYLPLLDKHFLEFVCVDQGRIQVSGGEQARRYFLSKVPLDCEDIEQAQERIQSRNLSSSVRMACYHALSSSWSKNLTYMLEKRKKTRS